MFVHHSTIISILILIIIIKFRRPLYLPSICPLYILYHPQATCIKMSQFLILAYHVKRTPAPSRIMLNRQVVQTTLIPSTSCPQMQWKLFYVVIFPPMWRRTQVFPFFHSQTLKPSPSFPWQKPPSVYVGTTFIQNVFLRWRRWYFFPHLFVCFGRSLAAAPLWCDGVCGLRHRPLRVSLQQANRKSANIFISKYANIVNWKSTIMFTVLSNIVIWDLLQRQDINKNIFSFAPRQT